MSIYCETAISFTVLHTSHEIPKFFTRFALRKKNHMFAENWIKNYLFIALLMLIKQKLKTVTVFSTIPKFRFFVKSKHLQPEKREKKSFVGKQTSHVLIRWITTVHYISVLLIAKYVALPFRCYCIFMYRYIYLC